MRIKIIWSPRDGTQWLHALELPTHVWVQPYYEPMKFPLGLRSRRRLLLDISTKAREQYTKLWEANSKTGYFPELDSAITQEFVEDAMARLEAEAGVSARQQFQSWAYIYFVREEYTTAFFLWGILLTHMCRKGESFEKETSLFQTRRWKSLASEICLEMNSEHNDVLEQELTLIAPPSDYERIEMGLSLSSEGEKVLQIIRGQTLNSLLEKVGRSLTGQELQELGEWAEVQAREQRFAPVLLLQNQIFSS